MNIQNFWTAMRLFAAVCVGSVAAVIVASAFYIVLYVLNHAAKEINRRD